LVDTVRSEDAPLVGRKGAHLGEMVRYGFTVPKTFIVTTSAYTQFISDVGIREQISDSLRGLDAASWEDLTARSDTVQRLFDQSKIPWDMEIDIINSYKKIVKDTGDDYVVVRPSPQLDWDGSEDFPSNQRYFLNIRRESELLKRIKDSWASVYSPSALRFRRERDIPDDALVPAVIIQQMIPSDASGTVRCPQNTTSQSRVEIEAVLGIWDSSSDDDIIPDRFLVEPMNLSIVETRVSSQPVKWGRNQDGNFERIPVDSELQNLPKITDNMAGQLAQMGADMVERVGHGLAIEWALVDDRVYILEVRREDRVPVEPEPPREPAAEPEEDVYSVSDVPAGMIPEDIISESKKPADVRVVPERSDRVPVGARIDVPARLQSGPAPVTRIMVNISEISEATSACAMPVDGVLELKEELLILNDMDYHPSAYAEKGESDRYESILTEKLTSICQAFSPRPVIYRTADFLTNEYREFQEGERFEDVEINPFMGLRGAARYLSPNLGDAFRMEIRSVVRSRRDNGCGNLSILLPFVRTLEELDGLETLMAREGWKRGPGSELWISAEVPATVLQARAFAERVDGMCVDINDMLQLVLGANMEVPALVEAGYFEELPESLKVAVGLVIDACRESGKKVAVTGLNVPKHPNFVRFLVEKGVDMLSVSPDDVDYTLREVERQERRLLIDHLRDRS